MRKRARRFARALGLAVARRLKSRTAALKYGLLPVLTAVALIAVAVAIGPSPTETLRSQSDPTLHHEHGPPRTLAALIRTMMFPAPR
jgi:hypothetical protein